GEGPALPIIVSAKNRARLDAYVAQLLNYLNECVSRNQPLSLHSLAYTLQGRQAFEERIAMVVRSSDELRSKLQEVVHHAPPSAGVFRGSARNTEESQELLAFMARQFDINQAAIQWMQADQVEKVAALWTKGLTFD